MPEQDKRTTREFAASLLEESTNRLCKQIRGLEEEGGTIDPVGIWEEAVLNKVIACMVEELLCPPITPDPDPDPV